MRPLRAPSNDDRRGGPYGPPCPHGRPPILFIPMQDRHGGLSLQKVVRFCSSFRRMPESRADENGDAPVFHPPLIGGNTEEIKKQSPSIPACAGMSHIEVLQQTPGVSPGSPRHVRKPHPPGMGCLRVCRRRFPYLGFAALKSSLRALNMPEMRARLPPSS